MNTPGIPGVFIDHPRDPWGDPWEPWAQFFYISIYPWGPMGDPGGEKTILYIPWARGIKQQKFWGALNFPLGIPGSPQGSLG